MFDYELTSSRHYNLGSWVGEIGVPLRPKMLLVDLQVLSLMSAGTMEIKRFDFFHVDEVGCSSNDPPPSIASNFFSLEKKKRKKIRADRTNSFLRKFYYVLVQDPDRFL